MISAASAASPLTKLNPRFWGTIDDKPFMDGMPCDLFPGDETWLSARKRSKRIHLGANLAELTARIFEAGETVLHFFPALETPPFLAQISMGWMARSFHSVTLIMTDRRLIEIQMKHNMVNPGTRIRSFPLAQIVTMKMGWFGFSIKTHQGRSFKWQISIRGDRKIVKQLAKRFDEKFQDAVVVAEQIFPIWHCPLCGAKSAAHPQQCAQCGTLYRSGKLAYGLALAFPGLGLYYVGHPVFATFDLLGELVFFGVWSMTMLSANDSEAFTASLAIGLFILAITKIESLHLCHILVKRSIPEDAERRERWRKILFGGACLSAIAIIIPLALAGALAPVIDHDIDFSAAQRSGWTLHSEISENTSAILKAGEPQHRSTLMRDSDGLQVAVLAYSLDTLESFKDFENDYIKELKALGDQPPEHITMGKFEGMLHVRLVGGDPEFIQYAVSFITYDSGGADIHQIILYASQNGVEDAKLILQDLLESADWKNAN